MTFKKDYNELLIYLLRELVKNALHFEEIVSGSTSGLTHIDVKVEDLQSKASQDINELNYFYFYNWNQLPTTQNSILLVWSRFVQAQEHEIYDLKPFFTSTHFRANFVLDEQRGVIRHRLARWLFEQMNREYVETYFSTEDLSNIWTKQTNF